MIDSLPRREREIFELLCSAGEATAAEIRAAMKDPPSYSAVRTLLARLEARGVVKHRTQDQAYVYKSVPQPAKVREIGDERRWCGPSSTARRRAPRPPCWGSPRACPATRSTPCSGRSTKPRSVSDGRVLLCRNGLEIRLDRRRRSWRWPMCCARAPPPTGRWCCRIGVAMLLLLPLIALALPALPIEAWAAPAPRGAPPVSYVPGPEVQLPQACRSRGCSRPPPTIWDDPTPLVLLAYLGGLLMVGGRLLAGPVHAAPLDPRRARRDLPRMAGRVRADPLGRGRWRAGCGCWSPTRCPRR